MLDLITSLALFFASFSSLFTIVNPFSAAFIYLTITKNNTRKEKIKIAKKACIIAAIVLVVFGLGGSYILSFFNITIEAFKIAGGIVIAAIGMQMIHTGRKHFTSHAERKEAIEKEDVSVIPLAIPMLSGPGAMTTTIVLMGEADGIIAKTSILVAIVAVAAISYVILSKATAVHRYLGETGKTVIDKIMGLIVLVVGVEFIINGIGTLIAVWFK